MLHWYLTRCRHFSMKIGWNQKLAQNLSEKLLNVIALYLIVKYFVRIAILFEISGWQFAGRVHYFYTRWWQFSLKIGWNQELVQNLHENSLSVKALHFIINTFLRIDIYIYLIIRFSDKVIMKEKTITIRSFDCIYQRLKWYPEL